MLDCERRRIILKILYEYLFELKKIAEKEKGCVNVTHPHYYRSNPILFFFFIILFSSSLEI